TEKEASSINKSKIASIRSDIEQTNNRLNHKMDQLWDIYNSKVKKYENMDDEYNNKASVLKAKYTNFFEGFWDSLESDFNFVKDLVVGIFTGLIDIVVGLATLVFDAGIVAVSNQIPDIIEPKFLKDAANERIDSFYTMVQQIVEDPFSVVEGIGQSFSDSVEEDGIVYVTGNFAAGFVPVVGWSKYARIGKVLDTDKPKKSVNKTANKEGKMVDPVELLLVNTKKVGIEFTSGVTDRMRIFMENLQGLSGDVALAGGPGSVKRMHIDSDDTMRWAKIDRVDNEKEADKNPENNTKNLNKEQLEVIEKVESGEIPLVTTKQKGNYGEMKMDVHLEKQGYTRISLDRVTSLDDKIIQGIDGVYENSSPPPQYIIGEAKYGTSQLGKTKTGKQMSDEWIDSRNRLDNAVGREKADEIRMELLLNPDNVESILVKVDVHGDVRQIVIDEFGNLK
uniref:hypothetical protein n=1 Tax=Paucisalibacillus globulus TaxID=351095 RepID=UPI000686F0E4